MSKEWKEISNIADSAFIKIDAIEDSFYGTVGEQLLERNTTIKIGDQKATFKDIPIIVLNPKLYAEKAQQEAWEIARKVYTSKVRGGFSLLDLREIFGDGLSISDMYELPFKEVAAKVEAWEEKKRKPIQVGDEVVRKCTRSPKYVVTKVTDGCLTGTVTFCAIDNITGTTLENVKADGYAKTGKKFKVKKGFFEEVKE